MKDHHHHDYKKKFYWYYILAIIILTLIVHTRAFNEENEDTPPLPIVIDCITESECELIRIGDTLPLSIDI